jgi:hypothetical protein
MNPSNFNVAFLACAVGAFKISWIKVDMNSGVLTPATCIVAFLASNLKSFGVAGFRPMAMPNRERTRDMAST